MTKPGRPDQSPSERDRRAGWLRRGLRDAPETASGLADFSLRNNRRSHAHRRAMLRPCPQRGRCAHFQKPPASGKPAHGIPRRMGFPTSRAPNVPVHSSNCPEWRSSVDGRWCFRSTDSSEFRSGPERRRDVNNEGAQASPEAALNEARPDCFKGRPPA